MALPLFDKLDEDQRQSEQGAHLPPRILKLVNNPPTTIQEAAIRRDEGMEAAMAHADQVKKDWREWAFSYMAGLVRLHGAAPFLAEELIAKAKDEGILAEPPDKRAWGGVFQRLAKEKIIKNIGYAPSKSSNLSPKVLWARVESSDEAVIQNKF